jgi:hypothetical protein
METNKDCRIAFIVYQGYHAVGGNDAKLFLKITRLLFEFGNNGTACHEMDNLLKYACKLDHAECVAAAVQYCAGYGSTIGLERALVKEAIVHDSKRTIQLLSFVSHRSGGGGDGGKIVALGAQKRTRDGDE